MIKRIVMWKFKKNAEGADTATNLRKAKALLDAQSIKPNPGANP